MLNVATSQSTRSCSWRVGAGNSDLTAVSNQPDFLGVAEVVLAPSLSETSPKTCDHSLHEVPVVAGEYDRTFMRHQRGRQCFDRVDIKVVARFVEHRPDVFAKQQARHTSRARSPPESTETYLLTAVNQHIRKREPKTLVEVEALLYEWGESEDLQANL